MSAKSIAQLCAAKVVKYFGLSKNNRFLVAIFWCKVYVRCMV